MCLSIIGLPRACGAAGVMAGVEKLYMIAYSDLAPVEGSITNEVFTKAVNGMVDEIGLAVGKTFVEVGTLKNKVGLTSNLTKNENGTNFYNSSMPVTLSDMSLENEQWVRSVTNQAVVALIKSRTGKFYVTGLNGRFELASAESGLGIAESDDFGYNLTFAGTEEGPLSIVDPTIVAGLIA